MAKFEIDIPDGFVPCGWEAVALRRPNDAESFLSESGVLLQAIGSVNGTRLIVRKKEVETKARPYNADEMQNLYLQKAMLVCGSESHNVTGHSSTRNAIRICDDWWDAAEIRNVWTHLDGSRCEVVE